MQELSKHGSVPVAALHADMDPKTVRRYRDAGKLPSETRKPRTWRTRPDPFAEDWPAVEARLKDAPGLKASTLFEDLIARHAGRYEPGQLRTFQRRVRAWRAHQGPDRVLFFPQQHRPGEAMQTDFTWGTKLGVTIGGEPFAHMLCHAVLPYSNWEWATVCHSESMVALKRGVQGAVFQLGRVPEFHQTDNSTAATHKLATGPRGLNEEYRRFIERLGMKPRTIEVGEKEQNGDVEALNNVLKQRLEQHLLLRDHRDFESPAAYERWVQGVIAQANVLRGKRLKDELAVMRAVAVERLPEFEEVDARVTTWSTIRVRRNAYSVPSRLRDRVVRVRIYDDRLEVFLDGERQLDIERLHGEQGHRINYRHIIWSLVQKPGAFERYRYREDLFPTITFRAAYDKLASTLPSRKADIEYLRVLHLAASTMESDVEVALMLLLGQGRTPTADEVKALAAPSPRELPAIEPGTIDLADYDALLVSRQEAVS